MSNYTDGVAGRTTVAVGAPGVTSRYAQLIATIVILIIAGTLAGYRFYAQKHSLESYRLDIPKYSWSSSRETLVIAVRSGCHYCEASLPFYSKLLKVAGPIPRDHVRILFVSPGNEYLTRRAIPKDTPTDSLRADVAFPHWITGTPTIVEVDSAGRVKKVWAGKLTAKEEEELLQQVKRS